jgi:hypothetical protein
VRPSDEERDALSARQVEGREGTGSARWKPQQPVYRERDGESLGEQRHNRQLGTGHSVPPRRAVATAAVPCDRAMPGPKDA